MASSSSAAAAAATAATAATAAAAVAAPSAAATAAPTPSLMSGPALRNRMLSFNDAAAAAAAAPTVSPDAAATTAANVAAMKLADEMESTAAATAAASVDGWSTLWPAEQLLLLHTREEMLRSMTQSYAQPGNDVLHGEMDKLRSGDIKALCARLGLPVLGKAKHHTRDMRASIEAAVREYSFEHASAFDVDSQSESSDSGQDTPRAGARSPARRLSRPAPIRAAAAAVASSAPVNTSRRSAAAAVNLLQSLPAVNSRVIAQPPPVQSPPRIQRRRTAPVPDTAAAPGGPAPSPAQQPPAVVAYPGLSLLRHAAASDSDGDGDDLDEDMSDGDGDGFDGGPAPSASARLGGALRPQQLDRAMSRNGAGSGFARGFLHTALDAANGASLQHLFEFSRRDDFKTATEHTRRECIVLARILDAGLRGDLAAVMEIASRRLGGVHTAAVTGSWEMCDRLEYESDRRTFVPAAYLASALKSVAREHAIRKTAQEGTKLLQRSSTWSSKSDATGAAAGDKKSRGGNKRSNNRSGRTDPGGVTNSEGKEPRSSSRGRGSERR